MKMRRRWSSKEVQVLRAHYPTGGAVACEPLLVDRPRSAIQEKARALGIRCQDAPEIRRRWKSSEFIDAQIRRLFQEGRRKGAIKELAERIGRPRGWITQRALKLGLVDVRVKEPAWSNEEFALLEQTLHLTVYQAQIHFQRAGFHRTPSSIAVKRSRRQLVKDTTSEYSASQFAVLIGVSQPKVRRLIECGALRATRAGTRRTEAQRGDEWRITRRAARDFITRYPNEIELGRVDKYWFIDLLVGSGEKKGKAA